MTVTVNYSVSGNGNSSWANGTLVTLVATADDTSDTFVKPSGMSRVAVTASGTFNYAAIYLDDADTGVPYGAFGAPMSGPRWCNVPAGAVNMQIRVEGFSGTTMTVTLAGGA